MLIATASQVNAQVTFRPGVRAGLNLSHLTDNNDFDYYYEAARTNVDYKNKADFYVGVYGALHLSKYYTLQPEINYSRQGATVEYSYHGITTETKLNLSYISVGLVNKFTFNRISVQIGPTVDVIVDKSRTRQPYLLTDVYDEPYGEYTYTETDSDLDLAFLAGIGVSITKNLGLEARIKKGVIPVIDLSDSNHDNVVYSFGATYTFDLK